MTIINNKQATIDTTTPALQIGEIQLSADRRAAKGAPALSDAQRIRRAVLPATHWGELGASVAGVASQPLATILREALKRTACEKFRELLEAEPDARTIDLDGFTVQALIIWSTETAAARGGLTITKEEVLDWYETSQLRLAMQAKGSAYESLLRQRISTLAAKNHGLTKPEDALKMIALLEADATAKDADEEQARVTSELLQRLTHIEKTLREKLEAATSAPSLDDL